MEPIGNMNRRIKFAAPLKGRDSVYGGETETLIESAEVWASVEFKEVGSDERVEAKQMTAMTAANFVIRYKTGLTTEMVIIYGGLYYKILSLLPDALRSYMVIETVQMGNARELALVQDDGQTLTDGSGNVLTWDTIADQEDNYTPPSLTFTDGDGGTYQPT